MSVIFLFIILYGYKLTSEVEISDNIRNSLYVDIMSENQTFSVKMIEKGDHEFHLYLPTWQKQENSSVKISCPYSMYAGDVLLTDENASDVLLSKDMSDIHYYKNGNQIDEITLKVFHSAEVASLFADTISGNVEVINQKRKKDEKALIRVIDKEGKEDYITSGFKDAICSRGNSTWNWEKKPYKISLKSDAEVLGMKASDKWMLLANFYDITNLRNDIIYKFASELPFEWTPDGEYVDLYLNGEYNGLYYLSEKVELAPNRLDRQENCVLVELTQEVKIEKDDIVFDCSPDRKFILKGPKKLTAEMYEKVQKMLTEMDIFLLSYWNDEQKTLHKVPWPEWMDLDSFVYRFLIDTLFVNMDSDTSSSYYYLDLDQEKVYAGPIWDYDLTFGNATYPNEVLHMLPDINYGLKTPYYIGMYMNSEFHDRLTQVYRDIIHPMLDPMINRIIRQSKELSVANNLNEGFWRYVQYQLFENDDYSVDEQVSEMLTFIKEHIEFLDKCWIEGDDSAAFICFDENDQLIDVIHVPYFEKPEELPAAPDGYEWIVTNGPAESFESLLGTPMYLNQLLRLRKVIE